jgi:hypothetical protein
MQFKHKAQAVAVLVLLLAEVLLLLHLLLVLANSLKVNMSNELGSFAPFFFIYALYLIG